MRVPSRSFLLLMLLIGLVSIADSASGFAAQPTETMTPLLLSVHDAPVPFHGSDGRTHLIYELAITNFSSGEISLEEVEVIGDGNVLDTLDSAAIAARLQPAGTRQAAGTMLPSTQALLFLNIVLAPGATVPHELTHRVGVRVSAAPVGHQEMSLTGGVVAVDRRAVVSIGPPLRGERYISADSCCDSTRHMRAAMAVNGRVWVAQRFAVDWEQLNATDRVYTGPQEKLKSYAIFGQPALAVADAVVVSAIDGLPEQTPGKFPTDISLDAADGNSVILDLGGRRYAMYAHLQPGSVRVKAGERVKLGQVLGLVGDSGNSIVPHLHFQVTDGPSSLSSNGLPYEIREFEVTGKTPGTTAFDEAESQGSVLAVTPVSPPLTVHGAMPLDQLIVSFAPK